MTYTSNTVVGVKFLGGCASSMNIQEIFAKGGPAMWPLLILSILSMSVVIETDLVLGYDPDQRKTNCEPSH